MRRTKRKAEDTCKRMKEIDGLLKEFGLYLAGFQPGVLARGKTDNLSYDFNGRVWEWLEPLLIDLRRRRNEPIDDISDTG